MKDQAAWFRAMHNQLFFLPNAWDGGSAYTFEKMGFKAIGTTSAGISYSKGLPDGESISMEDLIQRVGEMMNVVSIPLSVDMERGFDEDPIKVKENVKRIINLGAVGINIEDGNPSTKSVDPIDDFCEKIHAVKALKVEMQKDFIINARLDSFLLQTANEEVMIANLIKRADAVKSAGADMVFIPGPLSKEVVKKLRDHIELPINLYLHPSCHDLDYFREIGINRLSSGSAIVRKVLSSMMDHSRQFKNEQMDLLLEDTISYFDANKWFEEK